MTYEGEEFLNYDALFLSAFTFNFGLIVVFVLIAPPLMLIEWLRSEFYD